jgi:protocatechuate 3,4-dioxygenase beta subunit
MSALTRRALILAAPALIVPALIVPARARAALLPTPRSTEGPFYPDEFPADGDSDLVRVAGSVREAGGDILHLAGTATDRSGNPLAGARIEIWQCDMNGIYLHRGDRRLAGRDGGFQGFGRAAVGPAGAFAFRTIVPVPYSGRTPHIHAKVLEGGRELLVTQLYLAGFARNESDFLFRRMTMAERERASMILEPDAGAARKTYAAQIHIVV